MSFVIIFPVVFVLMMAIMTRGRVFGTAIYSKFSGGIVVILEDFQGELYRTVARKTPSGRLSAPVHFMTNVGSVYLEDDGSVKNSYVRSWTKA